MRRYDEISFCKAYAEPVPGWPQQTRVRMVAEQPCGSIELKVGLIAKDGPRGAAGHAAENTLVALERDILSGPDFAKVYVRRTHDGGLVLMRDGLQAAQFMEAESCLRCRWTARKLDAGSGERVSLLPSVLDMVTIRTGITSSASHQALHPKLIGQ